MSTQDVSLQDMSDVMTSQQDQLPGEGEGLEALIKSRKLSAAMIALNEKLLSGTEQERVSARAAIEALGFTAD